MKLTVTVRDPEATTEVHTLEELYNKLRMYEPDVHVTIQFVGRSGMVEHSISATLDE